MPYHLAVRFRLRRLLFDERTPDEALIMAREALAGFLEALIAAGGPIRDETGEIKGGFPITVEL
jgi:hypothetical protein